MKYTYSQKADPAALIIYPVFSDKKPADKNITSLLVKIKQDFERKNGQTFYVFDGIPRLGKKVLLLGFGKSTRLSYKKVLEACATGIREAQLHKIKKTTFCAEGLTHYGQAIAEGLIMGQYRHDIPYKTGKAHDKIVEQTVDLLELAGVINEDFRKAFEKGAMYAEATNELREWINSPPNVANTDYFDAKAKEAAKASRASVTLFRKKHLEKMGMGAILGVNRGSSDEARLIVIDYCPWGVDKKNPIVLVGKGVVFDSGGYNLKPTGSIEDMHIDKAGAATVIEAVKLCRRLNLKIRVIAIAPITENLIGPDAQKPSEIVRTYSGKTVEVVNTDAEGRLILADAIAYAVDVYKPKYIVDLATLTGACMVALGFRYAGLFGNDKKLIELLKKAGESVDEDLWHMPIHKDHHEQIKGEFGDIRNSGTVRYAGASTAAAFLEEFVGKTSWAHIDIAGPAHTQTPKKYERKSATGFGLRTLLAFLESLSAEH